MNENGEEKENESRKKICLPVPLPAALNVSDILSVVVLRTVRIFLWKLCAERFTFMTEKVAVDAPEPHHVHVKKRAHSLSGQKNKRTQTIFLSPKPSKKPSPVLLLIWSNLTIQDAVLQYRIFGAMTLHGRIESADSRCGSGIESCGTGHLCVPSHVSGTHIHFLSQFPTTPRLLFQTPARSSDILGRESDLLRRGRGSPVIPIPHPLLLLPPPQFR